MGGEHRGAIWAVRVSTRWVCPLQVAQVDITELRTGNTQVTLSNPVHEPPLVGVSEADLSTERSAPASPRGTGAQRSAAGFCREALGRRRLGLMP